MTPSKRLARDKFRLFEELAAYANMGDSPADWKQFRALCRDFFPPELSAWMYAGAEEWHKDHPTDLKHILPPLLWHRQRLRRVWARTDQHGYNLAVLLGFDREAKAIADAHRGQTGSEALVRTLLIPGQTVSMSLSEEVTTGFPQGKTIVNGITGQIQWKFGCDLQQAIYELMQERWRAKICPTCEKYFVAMKTAQKLCSKRCSDDAKLKRALTWWNEQGSERRSKARRAKGRKTR